MSNVQETPLNDDVLSLLLSYVSSPSDLLSVVLSSKHMYDLAESELVYRSVRCKLSHDAVWEHLIDNPAQAAKIRELEIQRENPTGYGELDEQERYPAERVSPEAEDGEEDDAPMSSPIQAPPLEEDVEQSERLLISALRHMVNLETFCWDRWVPVVNKGDELLSHQPDSDDSEDCVQIYQEDVWTALRDYTPVRNLRVVDLGRFDKIFDECKPIYESTIFTMKHLTNLNLKVYYSPAHEDEGAQAAAAYIQAQQNNNNQSRDDDDEEEEEEEQEEDVDLPPGRVRIDRLCDLVLRCPDLESLTLSIIDRNFYWAHGANPYTNITPLFTPVSERAPLENVTHLDLTDVYIESSHLMTMFFISHPHLRHFSNRFSLSERGLPRSTFTVEPTLLPSQQPFLPCLEYLDVEHPCLKQLLPLIFRPGSLATVKNVEPSVWGAVYPVIEDFDHLSTLEDVWGSLTSPPMHQNITLNLLSFFTNLEEIEVTNLMSLSQLDKLAKAVPQLKVLDVAWFEVPRHGSISPELIQTTNTPTPHETILPHVSKFQHLQECRGLRFWPPRPANPPLDLDSEEVLSVAKEVVDACPTLQRVSVHDIEVEVVRDGEEIRLQQLPRRHNL